MDPDREPEDEPSTVGERDARADRETRSSAERGTQTAADEWTETASSDGDRTGTETEPTAASSDRTEPDRERAERTQHSDDRVQLGLALLERLEHGALPLPEVVDRIETVTSDPAVTRTILDEAELRGIIEREDGIVRPTSRQYVRFDRDVITKEGEFTCRRCGSGLSTGHFVDLEAGELGPFGSSCIRKVTGRE